MNISTILSSKREGNLRIKDTYGLLKKYKSLGLIKLANKDISLDLANALKNLPGAYVVYIPDSETQITDNVVITSDELDDQKEAFDFIVCCDDINELQGFLDNGVVPIICEKNYMGSFFTEFNAMKNTGNSYLYQHDNTFSIFAAIVRYLENYKFSYDNKNLIKNLSQNSRD